MVSTIASTGLKVDYHNSPPILYDRGGGDIERYVVVANGSTTGAPAVFREETYESGFTEQDSGNRPVNTGGVATVALAIARLGDIIYIATQYNETSGNGEIEFHRFNMSSNTWSETNTSVFTGDTNINQITSLGIIAISTSNIIIVGQGSTRATKGTRYDSVSYWQYTTSWGSEVEFDDAVDEVHYRYPVITYDGSAKAHLLYYDSTNVQHKSLTISGMSLSSAEAVNDTAITSTPYPFITHYTASSTSRAVAGWVKSSNSHVYVSFIDTDGTPGAEQDATDVGILNGTSIYGFKIAVDDTNDEIHLPYGDSSTSDLWKALYSSGAWGTDSELADAITVNDIGGASIVDDGGLTLCVLYTNGTTVTYLEESLAGGTKDFSASASAALTGTADLSITRDYSASGSAAITGSADLSALVIHNFSASGTAGISGTSDLSITRDYSTSSSAALTGTVNLDITRDYVASGSAALTGVSDLSIIRDFSASASASLSGSANLGIARDFSGTASASLTGNADLGITRDFSASASAALTGTADLTVSGGIKDFSATGSASLSGITGLSITRDYSASANAAITGNANLSVVRDLAATASASLTGNANLFIIRDYSASNSASLSGVATLALVRDYSASASAAITGNSDLGITRDYSASGVTAITGIADLSVVQITVTNFTVYQSIGIIRDMLSEGVIDDMANEATIREWVVEGIINT